MWVPVTPAALGSAFHLAGSDSACQPQRGPTEGRRRLINVSAELRLYRSSGRMAPFISAPSAQAHVLLPRQPTRTPRVCSSPTRGCSLHEEAGGLECGSFSPAPGGQQERSWRGPAPGLEPPTASDWSLGGAREPCHAGEKERGASLVVRLFVHSFVHASACSSDNVEHLPCAGHRAPWTSGTPADLARTPCRLSLKRHFPNEAFLLPI